MQPAVRKHERLQAALQKFLCHPRAFPDVAAPYAQVAVHHRRVVEYEKLLACRRAVFRDGRKFLLGQALRQLSRIGNRRRAGDELRRRAVKRRHPPQPAQHVGQMAAKNAPIGVQLVEHDEAQILEQAGPPRMVRQNPRMQHVRVGEHDVPPIANGCTRIGRRVAVVGEHAESAGEPLPQVVQLRELVLRQGLGGEKIKRPRIRILEHLVQHRQVVAERFPRSRRRNHHGIAPGMHGLCGSGLVCIELCHALLAVGRAKLWPHPLRHGRPLRLPGRNMVQCRNDFARAIAHRKLLHHIPHASERAGPLRRTRGAACNRLRQRRMRHKVPTK